MKRPQRIFARRRRLTVGGIARLTLVAALAAGATLYLRPWDPVSHLPSCDQEQIREEVRTLALLRVAQRASDGEMVPDSTDARVVDFSQLGIVAPGDVPSGRDCAATLVGEEARRQLRYRIIQDPKTESYRIRVFGL